MIMKAPKDMNAVEFVDFLINGNVLPSVPDDDSFIQIRIVKDVLKRPAPNPFTPDQIAWMREAQRDGYAYAAKDNFGNVLIFAEKPHKQNDYWVNHDNRQNYNAPRFFKQYTSWDDSKPLCFADYAPLE